MLPIRWKFSSLQPINHLIKFKALSALQSNHVKPAEPFPGSSLSVHHTVHAHQMLDEMPVRDYKAYNAFIKSYTSNNQYSEALKVFHQMHNAGLKPDSFALAAVLKSAAMLLCGGTGRSLHGFTIKSAYMVFVAVAKALMGMYARFGDVHGSHQIFLEMPQRDTVAWNVLISGYACAELYQQVMELFHLMHVCGVKDVKPSAITIVIVLPVCAKLRALKVGQSIHSFSIKTGLEAETLVENALLSMYAKCGSVTNDARCVFELIACKDVISWNSMISGYCENGFFAEAFEIFKQMVLQSLLPNCATVANVLPICAFLEDGHNYGKEIHCYVLRSGLEKDLYVCNALLAHYSKAGDMEAAQSIFKKMQARDLVSWNTMITGCAMNGCLLRALELFQDLPLTGMKPDSITLASVLPVCAQLGDGQEGKKIHEYILQHPKLCQETSVGNALISFYGKCGELDEAFRIFSGMPGRDLISWNAMLTAYADNDQWEKLIDLSNQMRYEGIRPDSVTIICLLQACTLLGTGKIREAHGYSLRAGFTSKLTVGNALVDAYAQCGSIETAFRTFKSLTARNVITGNTMISGYLQHGYSDDAELVFNEMCEKDLTSWNLIIQVYAQNGCADRAFSLFRELQAKGMRPDTVSIMNILPACARLASVSLVRQCHGYKLRASFDDLQLEGALLDVYSKCGSITEAHNLFLTSTHKDLITFTAMIGGYAMHGMAEEALGVFSSMLQLDIKPDHVILTALLSACSHAGKVDEGWNIFRSIENTRGIKLTMEHYACAVDLLARRGKLKEAHDLIKNMPSKPKASIWGTLLGACKTHGEVEIGQTVADHLFHLEAGNIGNYVVMSNILAADGRWDGVERVRRLMKSRDLKKPAGCSWIEVEGKRHVFVAGDLSHPQRPSIYEMLQTLDQQSKAISTNQLETETMAFDRCIK